MKVKTIEPTQFSSNSYIISNGDRAAVVDPGFYPEPIFDYADANGLNIEAVLLTHWHHDHVYSASEFNKHGIKTYITKADFEYAKIKRPGLIADKNDFVLFKPAYLKAAEEEFAGLNFTVIKTPGHTSGGVCFACGDYLFTGDTLFYKTVGRTDLPGGDMDILKKSLKTLFALEKDYAVMPGHGRESSIFFEREHNLYAKRL